MRRFVTATVTGIVLAVTAPLAAAERPGAELQGQWSLLSTNGEQDKHAANLDESTLISFDLDAGTWKLEPRSDDGGFAFYGSFTVDDTQTPKVFDAVIQGDGGNTDVFAIYKIEKDVLTINLRNDGQRAADFELTPDASTLLVFKKYDPNSK